MTQAFSYSFFYAFLITRASLVLKWEGQDLRLAVQAWVQEVLMNGSAIWEKKATALSRKYWRAAVPSRFPDPLN